MIFRNRSEAGKLLAARLTGYGHRTDVTVVALPRGGVPVGYEIACALHAPLDVLGVRKLGVPENPEFAMGAIASGNVRLLDKAAIKALKITPEQVDAVTALKRVELQRQEQLYRICREPLLVRNRLAILTDDGVATGWTIRAAIASLRTLLPTAIVVAVPVAAPSICQKMKAEADAVVCLSTPAHFFAVGQSYREFSPISDSLICDLLETAKNIRNKPYK